MLIIKRKLLHSLAVSGNSQKARKISGPYLSGLLILFIWLLEMERQRFDLLSFISLFGIIISCPASAEPECGYASCPVIDPDVLNVHLVAHSHDDVGWQKTVDQYYEGITRREWVDWRENRKAGVQYTINTAVEELAMDPEKRYIQVETAFFWRWWKQQDEETC